METLKITILGRIPSKKNSKQLIYNGGRAFLIPSKKHKEWHEDASLQLLARRWIPKKPIENAKVEMIFFAPDRIKADSTNKGESVMDLLVDNFVLKDDNWFLIGDLHFKFGGVDRENPRVEITIEDVGSEADMAK